ncbi:MAG: hypothetical protein JOY62_13965 [Acidobacteriaceae bacterium]|nr:hypothetical protein [Acidobacteriaceae bacterium]MBV9781068.1 hypothetical protein [Acidobacteriaceae bacterium]
MREGRKSDASQRQQETKELAREIHWVEKATMWSQIGLGVIAIVALIIYHSQLTAMKEQLDVMRDQLELADRPWLKVVNAKPLNGLNFIKDGNRISGEANFIVVAKNIGKSVAINVAIHAPLINADAAEDLRRKAAKTCSGPITSPYRPVTVFPDDDTGNSLLALGVEEFVPSDIKSPTVPMSLAPFLAPKDSKLISQSVVGCITYTYPSSRFVHHSEFNFGLAFEETIPTNKKLDPATAMMFEHSKAPHIASYFVLGQDIPNEKLRIENFSSDIDAN